MNVTSIVAISVLACQLFFPAGISFRATAQPAHVPVTSWYYSGTDGLPEGFQRYNIDNESTIYAMFPDWPDRRNTPSSVDSSESQEDEVTPPSQTNSRERTSNFNIFSRKHRTKVPKNDDENTDSSVKAPRKPTKWWRACFPKNKKKTTPNQDSVFEELHGIPNGEELSVVTAAPAEPSETWCYGCLDPPKTDEPESQGPTVSDPPKAEEPESQGPTVSDPPKAEEPESQGPTVSDPPKAEEPESQNADDSDSSDVVREFENAEEWLAAFRKKQDMLLAGTYVEEVPEHFLRFAYEPKDTDPTDED